MKPAAALRWSISTAWDIGRSPLSVGQKCWAIRRSDGGAAARGVDGGTGGRHHRGRHERGGGATRVPGGADTASAGVNCAAVNTAAVDVNATSRFTAE